MLIKEKFELVIKQEEGFEYTQDEEDEDFVRDCLQRRRQDSIIVDALLLRCFGKTAKRLCTDYLKGQALKCEVEAAMINKDSKCNKDDEETKIGKESAEDKSEEN